MTVALWVVACIALPVVWGVVVHALFEAFRGRSGNGNGDDHHFPDYQI